MVVGNLFGTSAPTFDVAYYWNPDPEDYKNLMWTLFPLEVGEWPRCEDISVPIGLDRFMTVPMSAELLDKLLSFATASALTVPELIRRLLESEVTLFGPFEAYPGDPACGMGKH